MHAIGIGALVLVGILIAYLAVVLGVNVYVWNINDIIANGANFWNVFWIVLVSLVFFGSASKATS